MPEIAKAYEPRDVESKWYRLWLDQNFFVADPASSKPPYSIVIPPPNVTGVLTLGHVLNNTIQDILARKARMEGREVLWLPGTDHAGIATQTVVERTLKKEGVLRHRDDLGREKFLEKVWEWKDKHGGIIIEQLKRLGASCDWSRTRFTMDDAYSRCVIKVFVDLYQQGRVYRGKRMVNWCPVSRTALSDEEVIMKEQQGLLYYFKVEVVEEPGTFLTIATTRPETIPGDTAVAVHPTDERYARLIGKHVKRPLPTEDQALLPVVADDFIDPQFGTGVLKVTPAHDPADFAIWERIVALGLKQNLTELREMRPREVIDGEGHMTELAGSDLRGLDRIQARQVAAEKLRELGLMAKEEPYQNKVGFSERANVPIEPRLSEQWFLKYPAVDASRACVATAAMRFFPDRWAKVYDHWMSNIQDWCISRQLWWGHRIPVWYHKEDGRIHCDVEPPLDPGNWTQDPDVLDTWFSSWLWPFATMGWPEQTETLRRFYPTTDLVTAPDIIFFWVARMIMAGYEFMGEMPFRNVYFTGIIRDKQGRKMSKSLGNSPDPLDLINEYGADALRFGVMRSAPLGQDIVYDEQNVKLGRNFCNKLWNACRFRLLQGGEIQGEIHPDHLRSDDKWILLKLNQAIQEIGGAFSEYKFNEATQTLYRFFWSEYCDWYIEASKAVFQGTDQERKRNTLAVIDFVLSHTLRLFHPFLPFITEELWWAMGYNRDMPAAQGGRTIMFAPWPKPFDEPTRDWFSLDECYLHAVDSRYELVTLGRNLKREANIASNKKVRFILKPTHDLPPNDHEVLVQLLNAESLDVDGDFQPAKGTLSVTSEWGELYLPLEGLRDLEAERARLTREVERYRNEITKVEHKLANPAFLGKAPAQVLEEHRRRLADWKNKLEHARKALSAIGDHRS
jgi:valyl-tRNA synthetase